MELIVVGCSGSVSGPESPASAYLVQTTAAGETYSLLLDCGPGAFGALYNYLDPRRIDAIGLSHLHPDHCVDLCGYYVAARYSSTAPWPGQVLFGPAGTASRLARAYSAEESGGDADPGIAEHFAYRDWQPVQSAGPLILRTIRVSHPVEAYAIRVDDTGPGGGSLVYSGDTGPTEALVDLARGADLLLIESAFLDRPDNPPNLHLSGREAAQIGAAAGVGAVLLTHIPPWYDRDEVLAEATGHFPGPVSLAAPGGRWTIGAAAPRGV